jgi:uncharacterized protein
MALRTDSFDLPKLGLASGEGRRLDLHAGLEPFFYGGQEYVTPVDLVPVRIDVSRITGPGYALRLRFTAGLSGPCVRCLEPARLEVAVDAREVHVPGAGDELESEYFDEDDGLDLMAWVRDAYALALPPAILCRPDCAGLCPECGVDLNLDPGHEHERGPDPRWAKLSELHLE